MTLRKISLCSFLAFLLCAPHFTSSVNILVIDSMASRSHHLWMRTLNNALLDKGHNITALSCYIETKDVPENLHYIHLEKIEPALYGDGHDLLDMNQLNLWQFVQAFFDYFEMNEEAGRESDGFQRLLDYPSDFKFDLIIIDILATPGVYIFTEKFKGVPVMTASAYPVPFTVNKFDGIPYAFSSIPHELVLSPISSIFDRVTNFLVYLRTEVYDQFSFLPSIEKELRKINPTMRPLRELLRLPKIHLVNYNPLLSTSEPLMPNMIDVGGLQITEPKPLPKDLQSIYDDPLAKGVVIFSLGTNLNTENLGQAVIEDVLQTLSAFPEYNFIWKIQLKGMAVHVPRNVFMQKWLPQNDLLGQNKTKLFISHAGGLSVQETTWYGVPMLCAPGFFDQFPVSGWRRWEIESELK